MLAVTECHLVIPYPWPPWCWLWLSVTLWFPILGLSNAGCDWLLPCDSLSLASLMLAVTDCYLVIPYPWPLWCWLWLTVTLWFPILVLPDAGCDWLLPCDSLSLASLMLAVTDSPCDSLSLASLMLAVTECHLVIPYPWPLWCWLWLTVTLWFPILGLSDAGCDWVSPCDSLSLASLMLAVTDCYLVIPYPWPPWCWLWLIVTLWFPILGLPDAGCDWLLPCDSLSLASLTLAVTVCYLVIPYPWPLWCWLWLTVTLWFPILGLSNAGCDWLLPCDSLSLASLTLAVTDCHLVIPYPWPLWCWLWLSVTLWFPILVLPDAGCDWLLPCDSLSLAYLMLAVNVTLWFPILGLSDAGYDSLLDAVQPVVEGELQARLAANTNV